MPVLHVLAGPNGAGKSTYVDRVLTPATGLPFVNADLIAGEIWPGHEVEHAYEAAEMAELERRRAMNAGKSFISETVFSHESKIALLADASALGYLVHLHVVMVPVELTVQRVSERVRRGGHEVPEEKIRGRYERLWSHVAVAARVADEAEFFDNSSARSPFRPVARFAHGSPVGEPAWPSWAPEPLRAV
ncbi:MAG: AAA family ATPase [Marmoricola sp.]